MNSDVTKFIKDAKNWRAEMVELRAIVSKLKLNEALKWRMPCYTFDGHNVVIFQPFKNCLALMFFKGTLLKDPKKILVDNGPNSQASRRMEFHSVEEIKKSASVIKSYLKEAIAVEESGQTVKFKKRPQSVPAELKAAFLKNSRLEAAFKSLTPGRQRAYILNIASAKQASTRDARIAKHTPKILAGKGLQDR